jgi:phage regulator Rha-like protein
MGGHMRTSTFIRTNVIDRYIFLIRGRKVLLSPHLAELYGVETRSLNQAVKRNKKRFPKEFMFRLNNAEVSLLVSQNVIPHKKYFGGSLPYVFTEHGVAMLATVLNSERAVNISILIIKAFVRLRELLATHKELAEKFHLLEMRIDKHDETIQSMIDAIRQLINPPEKVKRQIGFRVESRSVSSRSLN